MAHPKAGIVRWLGGWERSVILAVDWAQGVRPGSVAPVRAVGG